MVGGLKKMFKLRFIKKSHQNASLYNMTKINFKSMKGRIFMNGKMQIPEAQDYEVKNISVRCRIFVCVLFVKQFPSGPPRLQGIASYIGCPAEFYGKSLFLKT